MKKARLIPYIHFCPSKGQCLKADDNDIAGLCEDSKDIHLRQMLFSHAGARLPQVSLFKSHEKAAADCLRSGPLAPGL